MTSFYKGPTNKAEILPAPLPVDEHILLAVVGNLLFKDLFPHPLVSETRFSH